MPNTVELRNRIAVNQNEAAALLGISEHAVRELLAGANPIPHFKHGTRTVIPVGELVEWAANQTDNRK